MRVLVVSGYTDHIRWDDHPEDKCEYGNYASRNHLEYCHLHDYSYHREIIPNSEYSKIHPTWLKIKVINKHIHNYDCVVWIDADAVFVNMDVRIEDLLGDGASLIVPKMEVDRRTNNLWTGISTGFMIWENTTWSAMMLNTMMHYEGEFLNSKFHEQSFLDEFIKDRDENAKKILESREDIKESVVFTKGIGRIRVIPARYHRCYNDGEIEYIFHAGGSSGTKWRRLKEVLEGD